MEIKQFEIYWIDLNPTVGSEIQKKRPCVVISPNSMQKHLDTVIIAPLTRTIRNYPTRTKILSGGVFAEVVLDQIRTVDKTRLVKKMGVISKKESEKISDILVEIFLLK